MSSVLLTAPQMKTLMDTEPTVVIDARNPDAYAAGHIPGAVNIHDIFTFLATSSPEGLEELKVKFAETFGKAGLSGKETAIIYEDAMNTGFGMSCRGYFLLSYFGYPKVNILHGGYQAWLAESLPVSTEVPTPIPASFPLIDTGTDLMIGKDEILAALDSESPVLLDVRDIDEWIGTSSSPYGKDFCPRKGRLPGAVWIEWYRLMKPGAVPMFKAPEEVLAECATVGISKDTPVYLYCFKGARASNTLVALKSAGIENVKLYFGSWNEWSRDPSLPIEEGLPYAVA
ncbi:sulfurtransferase [Halothiobacillus neapolitanus]|uniref:Rhodanese domain protein n=1 Tax=Halothiobacillus neapolitanus (strain ATCC 23641 / DSM 15147 / CIP 104769 / NCIMB 8539 / c2) TaxID=555778 RepID=D0KWC2_HALNC|nr:sulfurtransferase [Halothiobacillus neapolitanus]ACX97025.1 Rhodanese domain protein [Halothiobacillus neapolitanus c2]TDN59757.1 thiosulfate/3-mercaptopyruvate sulfurtransferase [Halothiobacillus neapolitanus]